jgi:hypothetical protein
MGRVKGDLFDDDEEEQQEQSESVSTLREDCR